MNGSAEAETTGPGSIASAGSIVAQLTWSGPEPPPQVVVIEKFSRAAIPITTGTASNGLGHPATVVGNALISEGTSFQIIQNPGASFTVTVSPSVSTTALPPNPPVAYVTGADVLVTISATPISLKILGTEQFAGFDLALVGQKLHAFVDSGSYLQGNHWWELPWESPDDFTAGNDFTGFAINPVLPSGGYFEQHHFLDLSLVQPTLTFAGLTPTSGTVTCTVDLYKEHPFYQQYIGTVTLSRNLDVPQIGCLIDIYTQQIGTSSWTGTIFQLHSENNANDPTKGVLAYASIIEAPAPWSNSVFQVCFDQLVKLDHTSHVGPVEVIETRHTQFHLDNHRPYLPVSATPDPHDDGWLIDMGEPTVEREFEDSPEFGMPIATQTALDALDRFQLHYVVRPPTTAYGAVWYSREMQNWKWEAHAVQAPMHQVSNSTTKIWGLMSHVGRSYEWSPSYINQP